MLTTDAIYRFIKLHPGEITLISLASLITILSFVLQFKSTATKQTVLSAQTSSKDISQTNTSPDSKSKQGQTIFIEVSGAVEKPDVYEVPPGTRLKDMIEMAGGLSDEADKRYVARNYNFAKFVGEQEKIYIPFTWDITNGTFVEQKRILEYLQPLYMSSSKSSESIGQAFETQSNPLTISINTASSEELDTLSGVGPVTAQKIIDNRPYTAIDDLLSKKVMNQSAFDKIKNNITP